MAEMEDRFEKPAPHDHKGYSEEKCLRCGWVMGHPPLNCNNDDTPHLFPSQVWAFHLRDVVYRAARDLYVAEIHRQGVGWDDYCTDLLVRSQHALAAETKP